MKSSIFGVWGLPQQAKTESSASGRNLFVLSLSDQKGIACQITSSLALISRQVPKQRHFALVLGGFWCILILDCCTYLGEIQRF
jgi:ribonuclease I